LTVKFLASKRLTALSTDLVSETTTEIGYTGSSQGHIDSIHYKRFSATAGQKITKIGVRIYSCSDTKFKGGVYTDNGASDGTGQTGTARPQTLLSQGEITGVSTSNADLWVEVDVDCTVPSDGLFWVGFISDDNSTNWYRGSDNTLASGGVYGSDCTPSGRQSNYANMMYSTANYGNGNNNQVAGNNTNMRYTISSPRLGTTTPTPTLSDDFSGTDDWTDSDSSNTGVNTTTDLIDFTIDSSADTTTYDLTTVSNTAWVLRFKVKWLTKNTNTYATFGISDNTSAPNVSQDIISMQWRHDGSNKWYGSHDSDGSAPNGIAKDNLVSFDPSTNTDYYFEIVRQTATTYIVRRYSDSTYGTVSDSASGTCASTTQTLRYIKFAGWTDCNATSTAEIDDVKFYNGITSASATDNAVTVPNGSVAEETDTGKHYIWSGSAWTEVA